MPRWRRRSRLRITRKLRKRLSRNRIELQAALRAFDAQLGAAGFRPGFQAPPDAPSDGS